MPDRSHPNLRQKLKNIGALAYDSLHAELKVRLLGDRANAGEFWVRFRALTCHAPARALQGKRRPAHPADPEQPRSPETRAHRHRPASKPPIALLADRLEGKLKKITLSDAAVPM